MLRPSTHMVRERGLCSTLPRILSLQVCGHGMGPNMATSAAKRERCAERAGVGPFPYVAGTLEVLSMPLAEYIIEQNYVGMFVQRAHARTPVAWSLGEDTVLGMWVHMTPFAITAMHWGWDKIHDLCFLCKDKTQLWKPITTQTVVVHIKGHQVRATRMHLCERFFWQRTHAVATSARVPPLRRRLRGTISAMCTAICPSDATRNACRWSCRSTCPTSLISVAAMITYDAAIPSVPCCDCVWTL